MEITCSFKKLIYPKVGQVSEKGYMIGIYSAEERLLDGDGDYIDDVKVVGYLLPTVEGIHYRFSGHWQEDSRYGMQFNLNTYEEIVKPNRDSIVAYLSSGIIKGIGEKTAERIYDAFGDKTLNVLDNEPEKLLNIKGISKEKLSGIRDSYMEFRGARDLVAMLAPHGISAKKAVKIYAEYGHASMQTIKANPYKLCEMAGVGFKTADAIAKKLGIDPLSLIRIRAGIFYALEQNEENGNTCIANRALIETAHELLATEGLKEIDVAHEAERLFGDGKICEHKGFTFRHVAFAAEGGIACRIKEMLMETPVELPTDLDEKLDALEDEFQIQFAKQQREAIKTCLSSRLSIITGGPGTGKTLIQKAVLTLFKRMHKDPKMVCCAPTGRAARRMEESTSYPATTIHKALQLVSDDEENGSEIATLEAELVVVDEISMLDIYLANKLLKAIPPQCKLILVGDAEQLPSVGPGAVLSELLKSDKIPVVRLEKVYRQNAGSRIAINASIIRHGTTMLEQGEDFQFIESPTCSRSAEILSEQYQEAVKTYGLDNVVLLSPYRKNTETGVNQLNIDLQTKLNPSSPGKPELAIGSRTFRLGDKVMQIRNRDLISNGDVGYVVELQQEGQDKKIVVDFGDGRTSRYEGEDFALLELAYAMTIHKSQGSEYQIVMLNLQMAQYRMLKRALIYTAITRAKEKVLIVGERKAICLAIKKVDAEKRQTLLADRINEYFPKQAQAI